jgi:hypothetical protein
MGTSSGSTSIVTKPSTLEGSAFVHYITKLSDDIRRARPRPDSSEYGRCTEWPLITKLSDENEKSIRVDEWEVQGIK